MPRGTLAGQLAAMGFADTARARALIAELGLAVGGDGTVLQDAGAARPAPEAAGAVPDGHPGGGTNGGGATGGADLGLLRAVAAAADPTWRSRRWPGWTLTLSCGRRSATTPACVTG